MNFSMKTLQASASEVIELPPTSAGFTSYIVEACNRQLTDKVKKIPMNFMERFHVARQIMLWRVDSLRQVFQGDKQC